MFSAGGDFVPCSHPQWTFGKLETLLVVIIARGESATDIWWVEARDAAVLQYTGQPLPQRVIWQRSVVPRLRNPVLNKSGLKYTYNFSTFCFPCSYHRYFFQVIPCWSPSWGKEMTAQNSIVWVSIQSYNHSTP